MSTYPGIDVAMLDTPPSDDRRHCLARLLRDARTSLPPPRGGRRRTPGWRREEVADAAGISVTWYTWLEQGRDVQPSDAALRRLAATLALDAVQTRYLFELARPPLTDPPAATPQPELPAFLAGLAPNPAYALDRGWTVLAVNQAAVRVLGLAPGESLIERLFFDTAFANLFVDLDALQATAVGQFRAAVGARPEYGPMVKQLVARSEAFARHWREGRVERAPVWLKRLDHPIHGRLAFRYAALGMQDGSEVTVSIYTAADDRTAAALASFV